MQFDVREKLRNLLAGTREVTFASKLFQARPKKRKHMGYHPPVKMLIFDNSVQLNMNIGSFATS